MAKVLETEIQKRFSDVDPFQHVNNVSQQMYFDVGKMEYYEQVLGDEMLLGDGSPISEDEIAPIYDALEAQEIAFPWHSGDMLLIDNIAVAHGRNPFKGQRDVQVALFD